jgi:hypothetical protein
VKETVKLSLGAANGSVLAGSSELPTAAHDLNPKQIFDLLLWRITSPHLFGSLKT